MDQWNQRASDWIFEQNNRSQQPGTIDLHGLYVKEAIDRTERAVIDAKQAGFSELRVIVGKGIHSKQHVAKIKPAIEELMHKHDVSNPPYSSLIACCSAWADLELLNTFSWMRIWTLIMLEF
jgi:hypothetical protein